MLKTKNPSRRVVILSRKTESETPLEVFSNLKILCESYPEYNYNTLNNYLSKNKTAFENDQVRIERKDIHNRPVIKRKIAVHVARVKMKNHDDDLADFKYWLSRPVSERLAAVTSLSAQFKKPGQRMDKTHISRRKMKP